MTIYRYFISIVFLLLGLHSLGQKAKDKPLPERQIFIRPGIDLSRLALPFMNDYTLYGFEASIDAEVKYKYFPIIEGGWNKVSDTRDDYQYEADGIYGRIGLNYNMLNYKHRLDRNLFFVGARYAISQFQHQFSNVIIANELDSYTVTIPQSAHNIHWVEGVIGLKGELVKNLFLGVTVRMKILTTRNEFDQFKPYIIPGFGKGYATSAMGLSYSISYAIPLKKVTLDPDN